MSALRIPPRNALATLLVLLFALPAAAIEALDNANMGDSFVPSEQPPSATCASAVTVAGAAAEAPEKTPCALAPGKSGVASEDTAIKQALTPSRVSIVNTGQPTLTDLLEGMQSALPATVRVGH